jgi:hypothetical protein
MKCVETPSEQCGELFARAELEQSGHWLVCGTGTVTAMKV